MNQSLFSLSAEYQRVMDALMQSDEITDELEKEFIAIQDSVENKILAYTSIVKNLEAQAESIEKAIKDMEERAQALYKNADTMRNRIKVEMEACKIEKAENPYHQVKIALNNPRVGDDLDLQLLPLMYFKEKINRTVDRIMILKDLKAGLDVPGASMVRETSLRIR